MALDVNFLSPAQLAEAERKRSNIKNVWSFDQIVPDPHNPMHVYAIQILEGHFEEGQRGMVKATKHKTRVIYAKMNEDGKLENVFPKDESDSK